MNRPPEHLSSSVQQSYAPPADLPPGWSRPHEMLEVKPTLAPLLLAFGLAGGLLGLLVSSLVIVGFGIFVTLCGAAIWAWDAFQETRE